MDKLKSRKLWVSLVAGLLVTVGQQFGLDLDPEQLISLGLIVLGYVGGQSVVDKAKVQAEVQYHVAQLNDYIASRNAVLQGIQADQSEE